jgi:hypothetical protein
MMFLENQAANVASPVSTKAPAACKNTSRQIHPTVTILGVLKHRPAATPLPAKKSKKPGAGGVMSAVEEFEGEEGGFLRV